MGFIPERLLMMMMMGIRNYHVGVLIYISKSFLLAVSGVSLESCEQPSGLGGGSVPGLPAGLCTRASAEHEQRGGERACRQLQLQTRTPPHTPTGSWGGAYLWHILDTHQLNPQ